MFKVKLSTKWNVCIEFLETDKTMGAGTGWQDGDFTPAENL